MIKSNAVCVCVCEVLNERTTAEGECEGNSSFSVRAVNAVVDTRVDVCFSL